MKNIGLKDFVKESIMEIIDGIHEASKAITEDKGIIAPTVSNNPEGKKYNIDYDIQDIEFDVAVTATESADGSIKAGIRILNAGSEFSKENIYA